MPPEPEQGDESACPTPTHRLGPTIQQMLKAAMPRLLRLWQAETAGDQTYFLPGSMESAAPLGRKPGRVNAHPALGRRLSENTRRHHHSRRSNYRLVTRRRAQAARRRERELEYVGSGKVSVPT